MSYQKVYMNQIYSSSIMRQVAQMWKNQLLCDAVIKTGNVHTKAHRLVLIAACPMLQDTENASVGSHLEVRLNSDISESSVKIFLQYLYEGYMMLTEENCRDVEKIAKMLHVDSITKCCTDFQKCLNAKMGYSSSQRLNFDLQDSADFRFVNTTDLQKMVPEGQQKRQNEMISGNPASKRPRFQSSSYVSHRPDDHLSMNDSYNSVRNSKEKEGIIDISEQSVELINIGPGARDSDGWPINTDLPPIRTSSSVSVANQQERETDVQIVNVQPARVDRASHQPSQQGSTSTFGRHQDPRSSTIVAGQSQVIPERPSIVPSHSPKSTRRPDESPQYMSSNIPQLSPLSSTSPKSVQKHRENADDHDRPFALGSAPTGSRSFSLPSSSTIHPVDVVKNTSLYESQKFTSDNTKQNSTTMETGNKRTSASPEPIIVKLEDDTTESGDIELYIQNPQNDSFSTDPGDPGGESQSELDPDMSNDGSMSMEPGPWQQQEGQTQDPANSFMKKTAVGNNNNCSKESSRRKANISGVEKLTTQVNILTKDMSKLCESSFSIQYMVEELVESSNTIEKLLINMTPGMDIDEEIEETGTNGTLGEGGTSRIPESSESDPVIAQKKSMSNTDKFFAMAADSAKTQAKSRRRDDFSDIPKSYRISKVALEEMKANSKNAGVFAGNVIKMLFPELFGPSNLRFKYSFFGGGILKKNELDRQRKSYMRRYVTAMYPGIFSEGDWKDIVNKVNEMLRRPAHTSRKNVKSEMEENNDN
ncbi:zinc finger and BTB domain-containing protein 5-like isoform X1 [Saccostrea cucullata]|uniref:zinc finger and BTB domain-containing protein 5-like isoform X1 n=1 Tax=Saccostrea cuccullata TaxID=36930 RepID=UPI002ED3CBEC